MSPGAQRLARGLRQGQALTVVAAVMIIALGAAACGGDEDLPMPPAAEGPAATAPPAERPAARPAEEAVPAPEPEPAAPPAVEAPVEEPAAVEPEEPPVAADGEGPAVTAVQELALLENYAATSFFPETIVVLKGVPVRLYFSRLHQEHVNRFTIEPFLDSSDVILPGEVGVLEFLPDEVGVFEINNVGHDFQATLIVVEDEEAARAMLTEPGIQTLALIYRLDDGRIFPGEVVVERGMPIKVYSLGIEADYRVSVPPFYSAEAVNVGMGEINTFEFTPDQAGTFTIRDELHGLEATLIVK